MNTEAKENINFTAHNTNAPKHHDIHDSIQLNVPITMPLMNRFRYSEQIPKELRSLRSKVHGTLQHTNIHDRDMGLLNLM